MNEDISAVRLPPGTPISEWTIRTEFGTVGTFPQDAGASSRRGTVTVSTVVD
jgi:hypothetical protein